MSEQQFKVVRPHFGDREYSEGEIRTAEPKAVAHLVPHVLEPVEKTAKPKPSAAKPKAKAPAPRRKGSKPANRR